MKISFPGFGPAVSLHNHSDYSDGADSAETMCLRAKSAGLSVFGLSDHIVITPFENLEERWWLEPERLGEYIAELRSLQKKLNDARFQLLIGVEVDYFPENHAEVQRLLSSYRLDYLIGSVHYVGEFPVDYQSSYWEKLDSQEVDRIWDGYWRKIQGVVSSGTFDILAHLDLPKKYGFLPSKYDYLAVETIFAAMAANGMALEINTSGLTKCLHEVYPGPALLTAAKKAGLPLLLSSDAHCAPDITAGFDFAAGLLY